MLTVAGQKRTLANQCRSVWEDPAPAAASSCRANIHRRHTNKGQRAMAVAMILPETNQGKATSEFSSEVSRRYVNKARTVLKHAPDLAANAAKF